MKVLVVSSLLSLVAGALAFQTVPQTSCAGTAWLQKQAMASFVATCLSGMILVQPAMAVATTPASTSETAARISLNTIPPNSISVQIKDLPVLGNIASGVYSKVPDTVKINKPSIVIQSPADKTKAIQNIVTTGHLEFDVNGIVNTHLDIDVAAEKAGVMVRID
jgi:hypothetical protein